MTIAFTGDTLPHNPLWRQAADYAAARGIPGFDFAPMFAEIAPVVGSADLAVCHLETPIAAPGEEMSVNQTYGVPAEIAVGIASAGYDRCSTASNHALDQRTAGIDRTVNVLEAAGLGQSGMARTPEEIRPRPFEVNGVQIAHLSYTFDFNGFSLPAGEEWRSALIDPLRIVADEREARALGADVVIVSLHWGKEGVHAPTDEQRRLAELLTSVGDVDLIVGHHAHVVQPIELINGTWVVFGLGNILSNLPSSSRWPAATQDAAVVTVDLTLDAGGAVTVGRPVAHPTWVDKESGFVIRLVDDQLARSDLMPAQRAGLEESRRRTEEVLGDFFGG